jgi:hypothetical protein
MKLPDLEEKQPKEETRRYFKIVFAISLCVQLSFSIPLLWLKMNLSRPEFLEFLPFMLMWDLMATFVSVFAYDRFYVRKLSKSSSGITI